MTMITPNSITTLADMPLSEMKQRMDLELTGQGTLLDGVDTRHLNAPQEDIFTRKQENSEMKPPWLAIGATALAVAGLVVFRKHLPSLESTKNWINLGKDSAVKYAQEAKNYVMPKITMTSDYIKQKSTTIWDKINSFFKKPVGN